MSWVAIISSLTVLVSASANTPAASTTFKDVPNISEFVCRQMQRDMNGESVRNGAKTSINVKCYNNAVPDVAVIPAPVPVPVPVAPLARVERPRFDPPGYTLPDPRYDGPAPVLSNPCRRYCDSNPDTRPDGYVPSHRYPVDPDGNF